MEGTPKTLAVIAVVIGVSLMILDFRLRFSPFNPKSKIQNPKFVDPLLLRQSFHWREVKAVNIKPMLVRLQNAIGRDDLIEQMVLLREPKTPFYEAQSAKPINLIVGYNSSPNSHTALDITLLIAHQTHLATKAQVTVQVVYVIENNHSDCAELLLREEVPSSRAIEQIPLHCPARSASKRVATRVLTPTNLQATAYTKRTSVDQFAQAERILRQASCLAKEWKNSFKAHLRFGCVATELKKVVASEAATLLFLGCNSVNHPIVQKLGSSFPVTVLGIPSCVNDKRFSGENLGNL